MSFVSTALSRGKISDHRRGLDVRRDQLKAKIEAILKAAPDLIVSGPDVYTSMVQRHRNDPDCRHERRHGPGRPRGIAVAARRQHYRYQPNVADLDGKRQYLLIEAVPGVRQIATLRDSTPDRSVACPETARCSRYHGVEVTVFDVATSEAALPAVEAAKASGAAAINFLATPLFTINAQQILERVATLRLPAMHQWPETAEAGGMIGYGPRFTGVFRQRARLVARVLRGAKPSIFRSNSQPRSSW